MRKIELLDCTLRDGGYVNNWNFGRENITKIINGLSLAGVEYVECGFVDNKNNTNNRNKSIFNSVCNIKEPLNVTEKSNLAMMMLIDTYDIDKLPIHTEETIDIIRLSFHKSEIDTAIDYAINIKAKGYKLFFQPTTISNYSVEEIEALIFVCNEIIKPDAFAIVDTLGTIMSEKIKEITGLFDEGLNNDIKLLLHCHNNMQLAYENAIMFIDSIKTDRDIIIDSSLLGMGRDSGNLCTELIINYLNNSKNANYNLKEILRLLNDVMFDIRKKYEWGYSPFYLLNALYKVHPKYGKIFRESLERINLEFLDNLLKIVPVNKKIEFDSYCAGQIIKQIRSNFNDDESYKQLSLLINNKKIVIINNVTNDVSYDEDTFIISTNIKNVKNINAILIKNIDEYIEIKDKLSSDIIVIATFEIEKTSKNILPFNYLKLLIKQSLAKTDDSKVMLVQILVNCMVKNIVIKDTGIEKKKFKKYKITKLFEDNQLKEEKKLLHEYINYFNCNYDTNIIKEELN